MSLAWLDGARDAGKNEGGFRFGKRVAIGDHVVRTTSRLDHVSSVNGKEYSSGKDFSTEKGLRATKFRLGFERRRDIHADAERHEYERVSAERKEARAEIRREQLMKTDRNRFNPISGTYDHAKKAQDDRGGVRRLSDKPSEERIKAGEIAVRNSRYRFYTPMNYGTADHIKRQQLLVTEGLSKPKFSSTLGVGRNQEPSFGVEDQFSRSRYQPRPSIPGLIEDTQPGAYPPQQSEGLSTKTRPRLVGATWRSD